MSGFASEREDPPAAGVDGCRAGWVIASLERDGTLAFEAVPRFADVLATRASRIAVDVPIGLHADGRARFRACDAAARALLGPKRSSVFAPPTRAVLAAERFEETRGTGLSIQAFHIARKIREVDDCMTPSHQDRVFEAHPELAFAAMDLDAPVIAKKRSREGKRARRALLEATGAFRSLARDVDAFLAATLRRDVAEDDALDACALAWVARETARRGAKRRTAPVERDARGLAMEICY